MDTNNKIKEIIERLRPYLINDGGDIEFVKYENGVVYVKLLGACSACPFIDNTLEDGVAGAIMAEVPEVIRVVNLTNQ